MSQLRDDEESGGTFNPTLLKLARLKRGLTLTGLAERSGVSLRSLTHYERGSTTPTEDNLVKLSASLGVPFTFFQQEEGELIPPEAASFRKLSKTTVAKTNAVLAQASLTVRFFGLVDEYFKLPLADIPSLDKMNPEQAAVMLRRQWNLADRPISNMVHLLEARGVRVAAIQHEHSEVDAFCLVRDGIPYILLNTTKSAERQRFDAAHELGHLVLHQGDEMVPALSKQRETDANRFAAAFLMPHSGIQAQNMKSASLNKILAARTFWRVSAMAMTHRLHELDLLSDWEYRNTCLTLSDLGYRSAEPGGIAPETSQLLRKVLFHKDALNVATAAKRLHLAPGDVRDLLRGLVPVLA